jgi:Uncharacterized membrane protein
VDLDALIAARQERWRRLDELGRRRRLTGAEADEIVRLYQATATDLSQVRSAAPDPSLVTYLSQLLARTRVVVSGAHEPSWRDLVRFLVLGLPAAFYRVRWWTVGVMIAFLVVGLAAGWSTWSDEAVRNAFMDPVDQEWYVEEAFASYYDPGASFAVMVWTNNAWIAALSVGLGISGVGTAYVLLANAAAVGATGGVMAHHGALDVFLSLIAPHGLLELTAIWIAGGTGLKLFWTLLVPGPRPRGRALAEEGRSLFTVALGLVGVLGVSGLVEGFVTGSTMPGWLKIVVGVLVLAAYWAYTLVLGRRAVREGETGDLDADRAGASLPVAA